jgi:hypothetical protein
VAAYFLYRFGILNIKQRDMFNILGCEGFFPAKWRDYWGLWIIMYCQYIFLPVVFAEIDRLFD